MPLVSRSADYELYCEKCGTTNFIYDDMKPPYECDDCGAALDEANKTEVDLESLQDLNEEGKYDGEV
jgi:transcription initiation factor TFIIIB Brf1 subunit/transcription initiation factor TFIIB